MTDHQASEQMVGYLYQVRYALQLLLDNDNTNYQISIEKFDDVAFDDNGSPRELIQLKHHVNKCGSLSDSSIDLWRTLKVWIDMFSKDSSVVYNSDFFLITTASAPKESAAAMLCKKTTDRNVSEAYNRLKNIANTSNSKTNKSFYMAFNNMEEVKMKCLLEHIIVIANADNIVDSEKKIRKAIRFSCEPKHEDSVFERLEGWWFRQTIKALCSENPVYFTQKQIRSVVKNIRSEYDEDNLPIEEDILLLNNIFEKDLRPKQRIFLEQLRLLKLQSNQLNSALLDYYRAYEQRARWIRNDLLYTNDLIVYERKLVDSWQDAYDWMLDELYEDEEINEKQKIKAGKKLYRSLLAKDIRIRQKCGEPFIMKGSYHILANKLKIGWHMNFLERLQQLLMFEEGE